MDKFLIDPATLGALPDLDHGVELCDLTGRALGWFVPVVAAADYDGYECPLSVEQLDAVERAGGGRPLADIVRDLERGA